jgi:hypothetical protein
MSALTGLGGSGQSRIDPVRSIRENKTDLLSSPGGLTRRGVELQLLHTSALLISVPCTDREGRKVPPSVTYCLVKDFSLIDLCRASHLLRLVFTVFD